jgi:hypothetical protein
MLISDAWHPALEAARFGDLQPARELHANRAGAQPLLDYFFARALTEAPADAPDQYPRAVALLEEALRAAPKNPLIHQTLALALARCAEPAGRARAIEFWRREGLPHDLDLLAQTALTLEEQLRPLPETPPDGAIPWPESLPHPAPMDRDILSPPAEPTADESPEDPAPDLPAPEPLEPAGPSRRINRAIGQLESMLLKYQNLEAMTLAASLLDEGLLAGELHLAGGMAAEEAGAPERARAHLARALRMQPQMLMARTLLGRVYWRLGWVDLALDLWRSLPVEGPYDNGRHYHLALGHAALGDRPAALALMRLALADFFYDTRHFSIKRAFDRWAAPASRMA